ncbi:MAG: 1-deoxy-D-xylulose-5-phosphate reductoisomerase [Omnitrophica bacterium RIFCSPLOWO2_01_FULL_45_10]|nr:MAG: 1-deoxy-D-xylulose-5-phosphate reductoisomerase [Omnitrophica bacterium RIFCSPLOWO2_01_FULL_45_10]
MRERIAILGSTGSIGVNTLKVVSRLKERFEIIALSADSNADLLSRQARKFRPKIISLRESFLSTKIRKLIPSRTKTVFGIEGLNEIVSRSDVDLVVFAISGTSCLIPLITAIEKKKRIALANKEAMVSAGAILMNRAKANGVKIIPIDSEHSAIFQCIYGEARHLSKIYLTGSGGPLLNIRKDRFDRLSKAFILKHPKWKMGKKISVDSATMMNKGLEVIEAQHLFQMNEDRIEVLIHPEAIVHSMVEFSDGVVFAQLAVPDMRLPIQYALTYPERSACIVGNVDFSKIKKLSFSKPDIKRFPCLGLARQAVKDGGAAPAVLNASDEETVKNYLEGRILFSDIPKIIEKILSRHKNSIKDEPRVNDILEAERWAREETKLLCSR